MTVSGVGQNYYQNNMETKKNTKNVNSADKFALEKTESTQELSEAEEMEQFKKEFYEDLSKVTNHRTVSNAAVNISEAAFKAMKEDPQCREKVLLFQFCDSFVKNLDFFWRKDREICSMWL